MKRQNLHFCHISDFHLGNRQYGLIERFDDFAKSFSSSTNSCIDLDPDFVIYTGDLFENAKPQAPELRQAVKVIEKLKEAKIPFILSQGNHDVSYSRARRYGGDILDFLADLDIGVKYIQDEPYILKREGKVLALILAVNFYGKRTDKILNQLINEHKDLIDSFNIPKILMLHAFIQGMPGVTDIKISTIKRADFDYVAVGHLHERWENPNYNIYCPGATEHTSTAEWNQPERDYYDVRLYKQNLSEWRSKVEFVKIPIRPKVIIEHEFKSQTILDIRDEAEAVLINNDQDGAILRFVFSGSYEGKEHPFLNLDHYRHIPKKALHTIIVTRFLEVEKQEVHKRILSKREAYEDLLKREYEDIFPNIDDYISLIEDSLKIIEGYHTISDQEQILDKRYLQFSKQLLIKYSKEEV